MIVLLDMDGVITDLASAWCDAYNSKYDDSMEPDTFVQNWDIHNHVVCGTKVYDILKEEGFGRSLPMIKGAFAGVKYLYHKYDTFIVSSVSRSGQFALEKHVWVEKNFPFFDLHKLICCHHKYLIKGDILVDDKYENIKSFPGVGILVDAPHNRDKKTLIRVHDWTGILREVELCSSKI